MNIDSVVVTPRVLRRRDADWATASYRASEVTAVYVTVAAGGMVGVGATAAHPRRLPADQLVPQLSGQLAAALTGRPLAAVNEVLTDLAASLHPRARLAVDLAVHDLLGRLGGVPSEVLWGGPVRDRVQVIRMLGLKEPEDLAAAATPLHESGIRGFKVKIGGDLRLDVARLRHLREAVGDDTVLTVDANGAYDLPDALALCEQLANLGVHAIEQPLSYGSLDAMATLTSASPIAIMADQLISSVADVVAVAEAGAANIASLKLTKFGSVRECIRAINVCEALGLGVHLGGSAAPSIVDSALTRLALSQQAVEPLAEVGESMALLEDDGSGVVYTGAWARSDGQPGLGTSGSICRSADQVNEMPTPSA